MYRTKVRREIAVSALEILVPMVVRERATFRRDLNWAKAKVYALRGTAIAVFVAAWVTIINAFLAVPDLPLP